VSNLAAGLRSIPLALVGSASARLHDLTKADAAIRMPLTLNRRIGLVQACGGAGASTVAAGVASVFANRRAGLVLGVNASGGARNMLWHAGVPTTEDARPTVRTRPLSAAEASAGLPVAGSGLIGLDLREPAHPTTPVPSRTWFDRINPVSRFYDLAITDWGVRGWQIDLAQVALASHVLCVVTPARRHELEEAAAIVPALTGVADGPQVVLVIVDVSGSSRGQIPAGVGADLGVPVLRIPHDPSAGSATPVPSAAMSARTRIAYAELAGTIMTEAQLSLGAELRHREATA
jgi:MinD-like ATPase involved in chromosome partitioning or flagellar assembly